MEPSALPDDSGEEWIDDEIEAMKATVEAMEAAYYLKIEDIGTVRLLQSSRLTGRLG